MKEPRVATFLKGMAAAAQLAKRASSNGYLVEYIILAGSIIDGLLRMGLVLHHQIETSSTDIPEELMLQGEQDATVSEREIYKRSLAAGVIDASLFDRLNVLYSERNRVVHRYVISDITTENVFDTARGFEDVIPLVNGAVHAVEERQIELGVGMTTRGAHLMGERGIVDWASGKHGADWLIEAMRRET